MRSIGPFPYDQYKHRSLELDGKLGKKDLLIAHASGSIIFGLEDTTDNTIVCSQTIYSNTLVPKDVSGSIDLIPLGLVHNRMYRPFRKKGLNTRLTKSRTYLISEEGSVSGSLSGNDLYINQGGLGAHDPDGYLFFYDGGDDEGYWLRLNDLMTGISDGFEFNTNLAIDGSSLFINFDGGEGDSYIYFYEGSSTGQHLKWDDGSNRFEFSTNLYVEGSIQTDGSSLNAGVLESNGNIYINVDGDDGDSYLYFYENSYVDGAYLKWDDDPGEFVLSHQLSMSTHKIVDVVDPVDNQDVVTLNYLGGVVSGSTHPTTATLDDVCDNGNTTDQTITAADFRSNASIFINYDGGEVDSFLYFYNAGSAFNAYIKLVTTGDYFLSSHAFASLAHIQGETLYSNGNIYVNSNGPNGDSFLYFYEGASDGAYIKWNDTWNYFEFSHAIGCDYVQAGTLYSNGNIYVNYDGGDGDSSLYFYENSSTTGASLMWDDAEERHEFSHDLFVPGAVEQLWGSTVRVVAKNNKGDYDTIAAALSAASSGDTILIMPGTYNETLTMVNGVNLVGVDRDNCILKYDGAGNTINAGSGTVVCMLYNLTIDHDNATGNALSVIGSGVTSTRAVVELHECTILNTTGIATINCSGGAVKLWDCIVIAAAGWGVYISAGASNYTGTCYAEHSVIEGNTQGIWQNTSYGNSQFFWCDISSATAVAVEFDDSSIAGTIMLEGCRIEGGSDDAVANIWDGVAESDCRFINCHLISHATDLIELNSGTATIGMYNCVINNDTKSDANLTIDDGDAATNYGANNILR